MGWIKLGVLIHKVEFDPVIISTVAYILPDYQSLIGQLCLLAISTLCKSTICADLIK